jgi:hypothetical protein
MKMRSKKEIEQALMRTVNALKACTNHAVKGYVQSLAGQALALRFALGYSDEENRAAQTSACSHLRMFQIHVVRTNQTSSTKALFTPTKPKRKLTA